MFEFVVSQDTVLASMTEFEKNSIRMPLTCVTEYKQSDEQHRDTLDVTTYSLILLNKE